MIAIEGYGEVKFEHLSWCGLAFTGQLGSKCFLPEMCGGILKTQKKIPYLGDQKTNPGILGQPQKGLWD